MTGKKTGSNSGMTNPPRHAKTCQGWRCHGGTGHLWQGFMWHVQLVTACHSLQADFGKDGADGFECEGEQYGAIDIHVYTYVYTQDIYIYTYTYIHMDLLYLLMYNESLQSIDVGWYLIYIYNIHIYIYIYVCVSALSCVCVLHRYLHTYIKKYIYIYIYIYICWL